MTAPEDVLNEIRRHGVATYPEECCGFLLGSMGPNGNDVQAAWRAVNRNKDRRNDRYVISADDFRSAEQTARKLGMDIVGMYHSHPDHPAQPSTTDLKAATFPGYTYVIVSIKHGQAAGLTAWTLAPDRSKFLPDEITPAP